MYPRVHVNLEHLRHNAANVSALCRGYGLEVTGVTKVFRGDPVIAAAFLDAGIRVLGDSRVSNLRRMEHLAAQKWLIRPPMLTEVEELVRYADVSLNSELDTLQAIDGAAGQQGKKHRAILMADLGDLREGYTDYDELLQVAAQVEAMEHVELYGIGTNLTCFSFIQSDSQKMEQLAHLAEQLRQMTGREMVVSGGNSATIALMLQGGICPGVNNLRLGESMIFGKERAGYTFLPDTFQDVFTLECEIVEVKDKPSMPWGTVGVDSYGNRPTFTDLGTRRKAVCALGRQDFDPQTTRALDPGVRMLGASSDHLMLDVTDSERDYRTGDVIQLQPGYFSVMRIFTSDYVERVYRG